MNPTAYTSLESLFLLQLLQKYGFTNGVFNRVSAELKVNSLVREQDGYDAGRLSPESLQEHLLQLIRDDPVHPVQQDAHESNGHPPGLSPTSKKRKLASPAQPTLQAFAQSDRLPVLVDKVYKRYRDDVVRAIKEDESRIELLVREIRDLETAEKADKIAAQQERKAATANGNAVAAAPDDAKNVKPAAKPNGQAAQTPVPVPTPAQQPNPHGKPATPSPAPPPQNQAPARASVPLSSQQPVKAATLPQGQPQGIPKGQPQGQPQSQPQGQPQGQPLAQPQAQPPAQPQSQPPAQPQAQLPVQSQAQPPAQTHGPDRRGAHPSPSPVPQNVRPTSVRPNNVGTPPNGAPSGLQHPQAAQAYGPPPASASPQPPFADTPRSQTPGIGAGARASPQPQSGSQLKWEPPYRPQQSPVPSAGSVPPRPPYTQQTARPPPYPNQPQSGGHAQHPQPQLPHAPQPHAHTHYPQNYAPNRQATQPPVSSARTPTPVASQPSHPVLLPPQNAGQMPPSLSSLPANATPDGSGHQPSHPRPSVAAAPSGPATAPPAPHFNPPQTHQYPSQQPARQPALASPQVSTPVRASNGPFSGGQRPSVPPQQQPHYHQGQGTPSAPATPLAQHHDGPSRHYSTPQQSPAKQVVAPDPTKRPVSGHTKPPVTAPPAAHSRPPSQMSFQTPVKTPSALGISTHVVRGHGTKWISTPTAATPRMEMTGYFDLQSPAVEPVSPPNVPAQLPRTASSQSSVKKEARKAIQRIDTSVTRPRSRLSQSAQIAPSSEEHSEEAGADSDAGGQKIKDEEATPKAFDDSVMGAEDHGALPMSASLRGNKRKRQESPEDRVPAAPPTHVLWTRSFNKVSAQALEQIISHRHANMFAGPVKARDAPGYNDIVMQPLDLKKVRAAINHGQRMAQAAEKTLSDIDPNAMNVWLPISVDLVPPKGIINIAQLERELVHMFVNAIMYAPDAERGFGQTFLRQPSDRKQGGDGASEDGDDDDNDAIIGYEVDENGLVKETRNMFLEVEKLLGDLRSEVERNAQPKGMGRPPSMSRSVSAVGGEANTGEEDDDEAAGEGDSFNTAKRRRTRG